MTLIEKGRSDRTNQKRHNERIVLLIATATILATVSVIILSHQLTFAQKASSPTIGATTYTGHRHQLTITTGGKNTTTTFITHTNQLTITTGGKTTNAATAPSNSTTNLNIDKKIFPLTYRITGAGNRLNTVSLEKNHSTLLANISSQSKGTITIELPRNIIDSKKIGKADDSFAVFKDGRSAGFDQIKNTTQVRTLSIGFNKGSTQIEIAGTHAVPEFGTTISAALFTIAIIGIILAAAKLNGNAGNMYKR